MLPRLAWLAEEPLNDAALLPNFLIERELGRHAKVALNGTGGDELFAGYGRYFQLPIEARYLRVPKALRDTLITPMVAPRIADEGLAAAPRRILRDRPGSATCTNTATSFRCRSDS